MKTAEALRSEIANIKADFQQLDELERQADQGISEIALRARSGDEEAERQLCSYETNKASAANQRRRLEVVHKAIVAELEAATDAERLEAERQRVVRAAVCMAGLKERAAEVDTAAIVLVQSFQKFRSEAAAIGTPRLRGEIVNNACRRALASHLQGTGLSLERMAPNARRTFAQIAEAWARGTPVLPVSAPSNAVSTAT